MLKSELIANAYQELRIWGVTSSSDSEDAGFALRKMEGMMAELEKTRNLCIGYNFSTAPDLNEDAGIGIEHEEMLQYNLAMRLIPAFNKTIPQDLRTLAATTLSAAIGQSLKKTMRQVMPSSRMPLGSGNRRRGVPHRRFNTTVAQPQNTCDTIRLTAGGIDNLIEDFSAYLDGETLVSYTMTPSDGLTLTPDLDVQEIVSNDELLLDTDLLLGCADPVWSVCAGINFLAGAGVVEFTGATAILIQNFPTPLAGAEKFRVQVSAVDAGGTTEVIVGGLSLGVVPASGTLIADGIGINSGQFRISGSSNIGGLVTGISLKKFIPGLAEKYISYKVQANDGAAYETVTFTITTSEGRVYTRVVEFEVG
jgi:hypothetical protein